jgi:outer membrane receptor protein involved in Fe transport
VVDVSMVPQMLIQRVDIVTGGASASWGSDAVAGVVNFVLDKKFEGFKANIFGGGSGYGDMGNLTIKPQRAPASPVAVVTSRLGRIQLQ